MAYSGREQPSLQNRDIMFCPECGTENKGNAKFCLECGTKIRDSPPEIKEIIRTQSTPPKRNSVNFGFVFFGIIIVGIMYTIPFSNVGGYQFTLSSLASLCENPLISILGGSQCQIYKSLFYIGWIVGIIFIALGLLSHD